MQAIVAAYFHVPPQPVTEGCCGVNDANREKWRLPPFLQINLKEKSTEFLRLKGSLVVVLHL